MRFTIVCFLIFGAVCIPRAQAEITEADGVRAIIGEASGEGERGMQAVAEVLRRRGSLRGVYGFKASHVDKEPSWVWDQARRAWAQSATSNITNGADHFESTDFKTPSWAKGRVPVSQVGKHRFFKLK